MGFIFRSASQASVDSDIATAFQRRFHISVDDSEQNNVSKLLPFLSRFEAGGPKESIFVDFDFCMPASFICFWFRW